LTPIEIIDSFFTKYLDTFDEKEKISLLFQFIQYIERQVVLFDAVEDAAFPIINNMNGKGTIRNTKEEAFAQNKRNALQQYLKEFKIRIVLTAHPTQFYPGTVLGIITDLTNAIAQNDLILIKKLLAQLGITPFLKEDKPTPLDEAISLIWYLENIFYKAVGNIYNYIESNIYEDEPVANEFVNLGFWPGGDRDGNPFVTTEITLEVASRLRQSIIRNYYKDIHELKRKLTFKKVEHLIIDLENKLYNSYINPDTIAISFDEFYKQLIQIKDLVVKNYQSLYLSEIKDVINKAKIFEFYFATLDVRQDSRVHHSVFQNIVKIQQEKKSGIFPENYQNLSEKEQIKIISKIKGKIFLGDYQDEIVIKTLGSMNAIKKIQKNNGEKGANRYIISNNQSALNVMEVFAMLKLTAFHDELPIDIVPLFETINDLKNADQIMEQLYTNKSYSEHLKERGNKKEVREVRGKLKELLLKCLEHLGRLEERIEEIVEGHKHGGDEGPSGGAEPERTFDVGRSAKPEILPGSDRKLRRGSGRRARTLAVRSGKYVGFRTPKGKTADIAVDATLRASALRGRKGEGLAIYVEPQDLREKVRKRTKSAVIAFVVDASGSMGAQRRMEVAKGAVMELLRESYRKRDKVAFVAFRGRDAQVLLPPTSGVKRAMQCLRELPTGGRTPLPAGLSKGLEILVNEMRKDEDIVPIMVLVSDGKGNVPIWGDVGREVRAIAAEIREKGVHLVVVDSGGGFLNLGYGREIAEIAEGQYCDLGELNRGPFGAIKGMAHAVGNLLE